MYRYLNGIVSLFVIICVSVDVAADESPSKAGISVAVITNAGGAHLGGYFSGLASTTEVSTVVLSDPDGTAEALARKTLGDKLTAVYATSGDLWEKEKPTMALITMEARLAPPEIEAALNAGCHVMAEKPAALNAEDFEKLVVLAEAKDRHLMLALANRLNPDIIKARQLLADGVIGTVYNTQLTLVKDQTRLTNKGYQASWFADKDRAGGGHLSWLSIHWIDMAMFVTDMAITDVAGFTANVGGQPVNSEDAVALSLRFENGSLGTLSSGYFLDGGLQSLLKVWGSKGWLEIDSDARGQVRWYSTANGEGKTGVFDSTGGQGSYTAWVRACVRASAGLEKAPITGRECLQVLKVVYGGYDAANQGTTVSVK